MERQNHSFNFFSSLPGSNVNNPIDLEENVDSVNASGHGNRSSYIGWMDQSSFIGSSHNPIDVEDYDTEHGWLPSSDVNIETNQSLVEVDSETDSDEILITGWRTPSQNATSGAVPPKLDLNAAHEDNNENIDQEIEAGYLNRTSRLERNAETVERNTHRRTNPGTEQAFPTSSMASSVHVGSTSHIIQPSYWMINSSSGSISSVAPVIPASGSDALWQVENLGYIARSTSVQSVLVPGQNVMPSRAFPGNNSSQNGTTADQLPPSLAFPQHNVMWNLDEEYAEMLSNIVNDSVMRLSGLGSEGQIGHHQPASSNSITSRGMLEFRALMMRAEGHSAAIPPILPPLEQFLAAQQSAIMDGMIVGPRFYEPDVHGDMHLDVDNMSYEELLALEEQIGSVNTGLSEDAIFRGVKQHRYESMKLGLPVDGEPCCVCQDEYVDGVELGKLDCGHEFHFDCIKLWLMKKNLCPICRKAALAI